MAARVEGASLASLARVSVCFGSKVWAENWALVEWEFGLGIKPGQSFGP